MYHNNLYGMFRNSNENDDVPKTYKTLEEALRIVKDAVQDEREDELFYDYLISVAPTQEEKEIITSIRNDEQKHNKLFRGIYKAFTGKDIETLSNVDFEKPESYIAGVKKALFGELGAVERYRDIIAGLPNRYYRDMVFEILTDEQKHADKYNYILNINAQTMRLDRSYYRSPSPPAKTSFTPQEAREIADALGVDFRKEKFNVEQFRMGLNTELEHGRRDPSTNVSNDDPITTGKIALAHLKEFPDYYTRLAKLEKEAKAYWQSR
jgi:rubrerythrin